MEIPMAKFMKTEAGAELEETIRCWDKAIEERGKTTPGRLYDDTEGPDWPGFRYWDNTCRSCQDRWEVFKLMIQQFYGIEFSFTRTDKYFGLCTEDEKLWLMRVERKGDIHGRAETASDPAGERDKEKVDRQKYD